MAPRFARESPHSGRNTGEPLQRLHAQVPLRSIPLTTLSRCVAGSVPGVAEKRVKGVVVVPTYNERENLPTIVPAILAHDELRVLIVDDRSPDGTADVAEALGRGFPGRVDVVRRD